METESLEDLQSFSSASEAEGLKSRYALALKERGEGILSKLAALVEVSGEPVEGNVFTDHLNIHARDTDPGHLWKQRSLFVLYENADRILEIGFNAGHSCLLALLANASSQVVAFDLAEHAYTQPCAELLQQEFPGRLTLVAGNSLWTVPNWPHGGSYAVVHVDGAHDPLFVDRDFRNVYPLLAPKGCVVFDDTQVPAISDLVDFYLSATPALVERPPMDPTPANALAHRVICAAGDVRHVPPCPPALLAEETHCRFDPVESHGPEWTAKPRRVCIVSTFVAPLGSGTDGGVCQQLYMWSDLLIERCHIVTVLAPAGSTFPPGVAGVEFEGELQQSAQVHGCPSSPEGENTGLAKAIDYVMQRAALDFDVIVQLGFDLLPHVKLEHGVNGEDYLGRSRCVPARHFLSMCCAVDGSMEAFAECLAARQDESSPYGVASLDVAKTFAGLKWAQQVPIPVDLTTFALNEGERTFKGDLALVGRVSPEKGVDEALKVAGRLGRRIHVCGDLSQSKPYWDQCVSENPDAQVVLHGFLKQDELATLLGNVGCVIGTQQWVEAFGVGFIQALATGTPVVTRAGRVACLKDEPGAVWLVRDSDDFDTLIQSALRDGDPETCHRVAQDLAGGGRAACYASLMAWLTPTASH